MFRLFSSLLRLLLLPRGVREVALENLALRQQRAVIERRRPRPRLQIAERILWVWLSTQQIVEAFPDDTAPRYLLRDRDKVYGEDLHMRV
jgi:hypothetical protein